MKKIKVINIQSRIVIGGPAHITIFLSEKLKDDTFSTILVGGLANIDEKSVIDYANEKGINCKIISEMGREIHFYDDLISLIRLYFFIRKVKPDIVHTHTAKAGAIGRIAAYLNKVPYIYHTFHGHVFHGYFNKFKTKIFIWLERFLSKLSTSVIVISSEQKFDIINKYKIAPGNKVELIPIGLDWNKFFKDSNKSNIKDIYNISDSKYVIGIIGRIVPIKDHFLFIKIAQELIKRNTKMYHFVIIGDGEEKEALYSLLKTNKIESYFTFTGWLNVNASTYKDLDLLLLTSFNEGTPVAIIEALASSVPVVATSVGGVPDIMEYFNSDYLIKTRNPEDFVNKIIELKEKNVEVSKETKEKIINVYSSDKLLSEIRQLYLSKF